jgi:hypothetical protein
VLLDRQTAVHLHGKGRKQRVMPLWKTTAAQLRAWLDGPAGGGRDGRRSAGCGGLEGCRVHCGGHRQRSGR